MIQTLFKTELTPHFKGIIYVVEFPNQKIYLNYSSSIIEAFRAFKRAFDNNPSWHKYRHNLKVKVLHRTKIYSTVYLSHLCQEYLTTQYKDCVNLSRTNFIKLRPKIVLIEYTNKRNSTKFKWQVYLTSSRGLKIPIKDFPIRSKAMEYIASTPIHNMLEYSLRTT